MLLIALLLLWLLFRRRARTRTASCGRPFIPAARSALRARKPDWVLKEVIRLKAHLPEDGCRKIADLFNSLHAARHGMTIGKSYVDRKLRAHRYEVEGLRVEWKHRAPRPLGVNRIWGLDLTYKTDLEGLTHPIVGIVDHGSRLSVALRATANKATITVLRVLLDAIERHGRPLAIRTDNERIFGTLFGFALWLLGIRHEQTEKRCPWQNGRVERFFGTLKAKLDRWSVDSLGQLDLALRDFRAWYNHVRPHQHLRGMTPAQAWLRVDPLATPPRRVTYFSAWGGMLRGFHVRR